MRPSRYNVVVQRDDRVWVYNGLSGMLLSVSPEEWRDVGRFLDGDDMHPPSAATLHDLTGGRMLVTDGTDELDVLERRYRTSTNDRTSFALTIVTSLGCNFDCPYCFEAKVPSILDEETERLLLEVLDEQLPTLKTFHVTWYGGEPLLGQDRLDRLSVAFLERTAAAGVDYSASIVTNGYLLTPETAMRLRELGVRSAQITMDGPPETHNRMRPLLSGRPTFDVILDNIERSADLLPIAVRVNLDTSNAAEAETLLDLLAARGLGGRITVSPGPDRRARRRRGSPERDVHAGVLHPARVRGRIERTFLTRASRAGPRVGRPPAAGRLTVHGGACQRAGRGRAWRALQVLGLRGQPTGGDRSPPLVARPERPRPQVAPLRPLHRRRLSLLHRAADLHGRLRPPRHARSTPATRSARRSGPPTATRSRSTPPPPRRVKPPGCGTPCCR